MMCNRDAVDFSRPPFSKHNASVLNKCYTYLGATLDRARVAET